MLLVFLVILLLFGANKLPELARSIGEGMNEFKKASDNLKDEIQKGKDEINNAYHSSPRQHISSPTREEYLEGNKDYDNLTENDDVEIESENHENPNKS